MTAVADRLADRFDERWGDLLGLGRLRRQTYVNSGFLIVAAPIGQKLFTQWRELQKLIDVDQSMIGSGRPADPFYFLDQDVLNALLASTAFGPQDFTVLEHEAAPHPPFSGLRVVDERRLRVEREDGTEPYALHHIQRKPWLSPLAPNPYSELLPRLWFADDLALRLDPNSVPLRFRPGWGGVLGSRYSAGQVAAQRARRKAASRVRARRSARSRGGENAP
jgi:hypothetical protein